MTARRRYWIWGLLGVAFVVAMPVQGGPTPIAEVNTEAVEKSPYLSFDGLTLYFGRQMSGSFQYTRIYQATRSFAQGPFTAVEEITGLSFSGGHVDSPWVSSDNLRMYYYRTEAGGIRRILLSTRLSEFEPWQSGDPVYELNNLGSVICPTLTKDERLIVFAGLNLAGGLGGYDLWMAGRSDMNLPLGDVNSVDAVNSTANDYHPALSPEGLVLYFASDRSGYLRLYRSERSDLQAPFGLPEEVVFPEGVPGTQMAFPGLGHESGLDTLFFSTTLPGTWDLYRVPVEGNEPNLPEGTYYVDAAHGSDSNHGLTPDHAFETIQRGIQAASPGDTVMVMDGIYLGPGNANLDFQGRHLTLQSQNGPEHTVIDCQQAGRALYFHRGEGPEAVVSGFTIQNGNDPICGGIYCVGTGGPTIRNCVLVNNHGSRAGALFAHYQNTPVFEHCIIRNNTSGGGAVRFENSGGVLRHSVLAENVSSAGGGAIQCEAGNTQPVIEYCTVVENRASQHGGGLLAAFGANPTVKNCIFWANTATLGGSQMAIINAVVQVAYCDVQAGKSDVFQQGGSAIWGAGNMDEDPLLVDPDGAGIFLASERGRYWPQHGLWIIDEQTSPCIDAGDPLDDHTAEPVPHGQRANMGAHGATGMASLSLVEEDCFQLDFNGDGVVNLQDLYDMIDAWLGEWELALR